MDGFYPYLGFMNEPMRVAVQVEVETREESYVLVDVLADVDVEAETVDLIEPSRHDYDARDARRMEDAAQLAAHRQADAAAASKRLCADFLNASRLSAQVEREMRGVGLNGRAEDDIALAVTRAA